MDKQTNLRKEMFLFEKMDNIIIWIYICRPKTDTPFFASDNTLDMTEPSGTALSTTMPVSVYSEPDPTIDPTLDPTFNSDSEDSIYDYEVFNFLRIQRWN